MQSSGFVKINGFNYAEWAEHIQFQLGVMNLDLALAMEQKPAALTDESTDAEKSTYEAWDRSNRLSLNLMRMMIAENVKPSMPKTGNAKEFMAKLKEYSRSDITDKSIAGNLLTELTNKKFDWSCSMNDHVTSMVNLAAKYASKEVKLDDSLVVQFIMNSLPTQFGQFQVNYNSLKDKWNLQEIKAMLIQEEGRLKKSKEHSVHFTVHNEASSSKAKPRYKNNKKGNASLKVNDGQIRKDICYFCKKSGHYKKDCLKGKSWFEKKGMYYVSVCLESNLMEVPNNTWWLDTSTTTHVSHITQGFLSIQPIRRSDQFLYMGNIMKARIEGIGTYHLILDTGYHLDLEKCLYVPECARNLVSVAKLDKLGFKFEIGNGVFSLCKNKYCYGSGALIEDLYRFNLDVMFAESLFNIEQSIGKKRSAYNENSAFLWHKRLGHISKERVMRLIKMTSCLNWILLIGTYV